MNTHKILAVAVLGLVAVGAWTVGVIGQFRLAGMPDGHYDIMAKCKDYARVVASGVRAGTQGLELRMEGAPPARVEAFMDTGGIPMETCVTLVGRHGSSSAESIDAPELDPGLDWIGAQAKAADGTMFAQMGTGLVSVQAGEHRVSLRMRAHVALSGLITGDFQRAGLGVALATIDGRLIPMDVWRHSTATIVDVGARGDFRLDAVTDVTPSSIQ